MCWGLVWRCVWDSAAAEESGSHVPSPPPSPPPASTQSLRSDITERQTNTHQETSRYQYTVYIYTVTQIKYESLLIQRIKYLTNQSNSSKKMEQNNNKNATKQSYSYGTVQTEWLANIYDHISISSRAATWFSLSINLSINFSINRLVVL